jgi:phage terminase large subunit-like protein
MSWRLVYKRAVEPNGELLFPTKLTAEFLEIQKRKLGSYAYSNQYMNEIIPEELQTFKKHWFKYYTTLPERHWTFAMIDPAIGQKKTSDYTGTTVVSVDIDTNWYVRMAKMERLTPTQIVDSCFALQKQFNCMAIGIEAVAYQEALLYMCAEEMKRRKVMLPIKEIRPPTDRTKETRIRSLVPRYEFGRIYHCQGLTDLESQLLLFPRGSFVDIADSLCAQEELVIYPEKEKEKDVKPHSPSDPRYESWLIRQRYKNANET